MFESSLEHMKCAEFNLITSRKERYISINDGTVTMDLEPNPLGSSFFSVSINNIVPCIICSDQIIISEDPYIVTVWAVIVLGVQVQ